MYDSLPLVEFEYPDSDTNHQKIRYVRVLTLDNAHITATNFHTLMLRILASIKNIVCHVSFVREFTC